MERCPGERAGRRDCYRRAVVDYCPRCGSRGQGVPRFCVVCSEGVANAERAAELVEAAALGDPAAVRLLEDITDPRAFEVVARRLRTPTGACDARR